MASLLAISFLGRTAVTADVTALTMYVVLGLDMSYGAAGGVVAALTAGIALGGPLLGRMIDARGLRVVLLTTVAVQIVFWLSVPALPYGVLLGASLVAGLLMVPVQPVTRQAIAAMTTERQRRAAFSLESVQGELSYLVGPAVVLVCAAQLPIEVVAWAVGAGIVAGGIGIALLNPPLRAVDEAEVAERPPRGEWLNARMIAALATGFGTTMLLSGIDIAVVASLQEVGQVSWAAAVIAVLGVSSVVGGLVYGSLPWSMPTWLLLGLLGLLTAPVGLAQGGPWLCVAAIGSGLLTAPTLATVSDAVNRLAPAGVRGEAAGLQSSALSGGFALGAPLAGMAIDATVPAGGFVAAGLTGVTAALVGYLLSRRSPARTRPVAGVVGTPDPEPSKVNA